MNKIVVIASLLVFGLLACDKEKKINKNLWNGSGTWNINKLEVEIQTDDQPSFGLPLEDVGTVEFYEDETGVINLDIMGNASTEHFTYHYEEDKMSMKGSENSTLLSEETLEFDMFWKKNYMKLDNIAIEKEYDDNDSLISVTKTTTHLVLRKLKK